MSRSRGIRKSYSRAESVLLTEQILSLQREGMMRREIASRLGVTIHKVNKTLKKAGPVLTKEQRRDNVARGHTRVVSHDLEEEVVRLRDSGMSRPEISEKLGLRLSTVHSVVNRRCDSLDSLQMSKVHQSRYDWGHLRRVVADLNMELVDGIGKDDSDPVGQRVVVRCHCGRTFDIYPYNLLREGRPTKSCGCVKSHVQNELAAAIERLGVRIETNDRSQLRNRELDVWIPDRRVAIEYCGNMWHGQRWRERLRASGRRVKISTHLLDKLERCEQKNIRLVTVFADEWLNHPQKVLGYLGSILGCGLNRIGARQLTVEKVSFREVREFLEQNHIQGAAGSGEASYVLRDRGGDILACMTCSQTSVADVWGLDRYCVKIGYGVAGAFPRLLKAFIDDHTPRRVVTFADRRWSRGDVYLRNGFRLDGVTRPSYWYTLTSSQDDGRYHKSLFRKDRIARRLGPLLDGETEWQAMRRFGYDRVWDCGLLRFVIDP